MPDSTSSIDCQTAVSKLWDYLDEELNDQRMAEVHHHLEECASCLPHAEFGRRFLDALQAVRDHQVMPDIVRSQVVLALTEAGYSPPG